MMNQIHAFDFSIKHRLNVNALTAQAVSFSFQCSFQ